MNITVRHEPDKLLTFSEIQSTLLNPTEEGENHRKFISLILGTGKEILGSLEIVMGTVAAISMIGMVLSQGFAFLAITRLIGTLCAHDVRVITHNLKELMASSSLTRTQAATSPENLTRVCLKGTLVSERLFDAPWIKQLTQT